MLDRARRLARDRNNDRGAVAVLFAIFLIVFMVLLAFVVDLGQVYAKRASVQGAADAAALAAVQGLPTSAACTGKPAPMSGPCQTAGDYAVSNGFSRSDTFASYTAYGYEVTVQIDSTVPVTFGRVFNGGSATRSVSARAVARKEVTDSSAYGVFAAGLWRVNGGGTGLSVAGGGGYAGSLDFNGNANNKDFLSPVGLESPDTGTTTKWTDSTGTARNNAIYTASKGTALSYAQAIGLDSIITGYGTPPAANWAKAAPSGDCTINQAKLTALAGTQVIYCDGTATVSGNPGASTKMIRAAQINIGANIGWDGTSCTSTVILYSTGSGGVQNSGGNNTVCGTLYAPNGEFGTNGGGVTLKQGRIIAASILLSGNGGAFVSTSGDPFLQTTKARLIE